MQDWMVKLMVLVEMTKLTACIKALSRLVSTWKHYWIFFLLETEMKIYL